MIELSALAPWVAITVAIGSLFYSIFNGRSKALEDKLELKASKEVVEAIGDRVNEKASREQVAILASKLDLVEDRATRIESDLRHLPDHDTVNKLEGMISVLSRDVGILSERIRPVAAIADRLQEKILETAGFDR